MDDVENALRLIEKINDRHESAIQETRKEVSKLQVKTGTQEQKINSIHDTQTKIEKIQQELQLFKSKIIGMATVGVAVFETVKIKFFG